MKMLKHRGRHLHFLFLYINNYHYMMKPFKQHILEKLKVSVNLKIDTRDDDTVKELYGNAEDNEKFKKYLQDCLKRDKYDIPIRNIEFIHDNVMILHDSICRMLCKFSKDDTYIGLYNRIIDVLKEKHFITEKLKVSSNNFKDNKEYKDKTNRVTYYNAYNYHSEILEVDSMDLFMDYWYHFLESEDDALKENLELHWDDIYLDSDKEDVYVLDSNTGDIITYSHKENPRTFYNTYNRIIEYFGE